MKVASPIMELNVNVDFQLTTMSISGWRRGRKPRKVLGSAHEIALPVE